MNKSILSIALAAGSLAASDSGGLAGPVAGYVFEPRSGAVRAIEGLPGAARLGSRLPLPFRVALATSVAGRDYAVLVPESGAGPVIARGLRSSTPEILDVPGAIQASAVSIAASGDAALFYSESTRRLQFVDGLPSAPRALDPIDVGFLDASPAALAVDSAGSAALLAAPDGRIYLVLRDAASPLALGRLAGVTSLSFLPGRDAALAASAETGEVLLIEGWNGTISIRTVAGPATGIASARAVRALDGRTAAVISGDGRLAFVDLENGSLEWIPLASEAQDFDPLDSGLFALNRAGAAPLLLLDAAKGRSVWFVPPAGPPARPRNHGKNLILEEDRPD
jgi:hypothetical protein